MRPLQLTMTAFGPFVDTVRVDLRSVADQQIFGIYGPTGSGKTSILDAITFALFGESSGGVERQPGHLRCEHAAADVETWVELLFEIAGRRFLVRRTPDQQVAKKRGEGLTERKHEAYLFDCTELAVDQVAFPQQCGSPLAEKKVTEVEEHVVALLGYTAEQFRQVVMLPQGRFRVFLSASSDDRSKILRNLFDIRIFERLTAGLKDRRRSLESARRECDQEIRVLLEQAGVADTEALAARVEKERTQVATLTAQTERAAATETQRRQALTDARTLAEAFAAARAAREELNALESRAEQISAIAARLEAAQRAGSVLPYVTHSREHADAHEQARKQREAREADQRAASDRLVRATDRLEESEQRSDEREQLKERAQTLSQWHTLVTGAQSLERGRADAASAKREAAAVRGAAAERARAAADAVTRAEAARRSADAATVRKAELASERGEIAASRDRLEQLARMQRRRADVAASLVSAEQVLRAAEERLADAAAALEDAVERYFSNAAHVLARELREGEPCPVCGATDHPAPAHQRSAGRGSAGPDAQIGDAQEHLQSARDSERTARKERDAHFAAAQKLRVTVEELDSEIAAAPGDDGDLASVTKRLATIDQELADTEQAITQSEDEASRADALRAEAAAAGEEQERAAEAEWEADASVRELTARLAERLEAVPEEMRDADRLVAAQEAAEKEATEQEQRHRELQQAHQQAEREWTRAESAYSAAVEAEELAAGRAAEAQQELQARLQAAGFSSTADVEEAVLLPADRETLEEQQRRYVEQRSAAHDRARRSRAAVEGKAEPDVDGLSGAHEAAETEHRELLAQLGAARRGLQTLEQIAESVAGADARGREVDTELVTVAFLAEVADGRGANTARIPLVDYALAVYFDQVLSAANLRFARMSKGRYELRRKRAPSGGRGKSGLEIAVYDAFSDSERDAATLSGGEGFLASLALALGLSDVVQAESGGIRLDAIFIDEGFGHLDTEALDEALQTLLELSGAAARSVGIISHVEEVKRAVPVGFELSSGVRGSSVRLRTG